MAGLLRQHRLEPRLVKIDVRAETRRIDERVGSPGDVAIKVLPPSFALDENRVARFEQEAKTLASPNDVNALSRSMN